MINYVLVCIGLSNAPRKSCKISAAISLATYKMHKLGCRSLALDLTKR
jgi:hypothetical protein